MEFKLDMNIGLNILCGKCGKPLKVDQLYENHIPVNQILTIIVIPCDCYKDAIIIQGACNNRRKDEGQ